MTPVRPKSDLPPLYLFSDCPIVSSSFNRGLTAKGFEPLSQDLSAPFSLTPNSLAAWIITDFAASAPTIANLLSRSSVPPSKVLVVFPFDKPFNSQSELSLWIIKTNGYINEITKISLQKQVDIRFVAHASTFTSNQVGEGSALNHVVSALKIGTLPSPSSQPLFPLHLDQFTETVIGLWFDRGHRHQTVLLQGSPISSAELNHFFNQLEARPSRSSSQIWSVGEGIVYQDKIENKTDTSILYQNLTLQFNLNSPQPAPKLEPPRLVPPEPVLPPTKSAPAFIPPAAPKNVTAAPKDRSWKKYIKYELIAIFSTLFAYTFVTYGLFAFSLAKAARFDPSAGHQLSEFSQNLQAAKSRYQKLVILPTFNPYFEARYNSVGRSLLINQAKYHGSRALSMILGGLEGEPYKEISQAKLILDQLYELETRSQADASIIKTLESLRQFLTLYPQIIPETQKITILLLFQNNLELRPTGGFIGSVGLATFDRGKLLNLETRNIYDLDANLRGVVTPPTDITQYLGESSWYFRDSNWNPDFVESAKSANWFLDKEQGSRADLIIGLNVNPLRAIIAGLGSLTLPNGATVNSDNLAYTVLNSQDSPASSDTQPELLSLITSALISQINQASAATKTNVLQAIYTSLISGEITLSTPNRPLSAILDDLRLSGAVYSPECASNLPAPCFADHFYLNEANVGINKANYYLSRQYTHQTSFSSGSIVHTHKLNLQNASPDNTWPAGSYKAYYRAYLPSAATEVVINLDGQALPIDKLAFSSQPDFRIIGWFSELKTQSNSELVLTYKLPLSPDLKSYQLFIQKQPGLLPGNFSYNFSGYNIPYATEVNFNTHLTFPIKFSP